MYDGDKANRLGIEKQDWRAQYIWASAWLGSYAVTSPEERPEGCVNNRVQNSHGFPGLSSSFPQAVAIYLPCLAKKDEQTFAFLSH